MSSVIIEILEKYKMDEEMINNINDESISLLLLCLRSCRNLLPNLLFLIGEIGIVNGCFILEKIDVPETNIRRCYCYITRNEFILEIEDGICVGKLYIYVDVNNTYLGLDQYIIIDDEQVAYGLQIVSNHLLINE